MDELRKYKRTDEYQTYKCHAYWSWNKWHTLCGRDTIENNKATSADKVDCFDCLRAIEGIEQIKMEEVAVH